MTPDVRSLLSAAPFPAVCRLPPASYQPGGVSSYDCRCRHVFRDDAAGCHDSVGADRHTSQNQRPGAKPGSVSNFDWASDEIERRFAVVMAASADIHLLRNADVASQPDIGQIVDPNPLSDPAMIAHIETPGILDPHTGLNHQPAANPGAKWRSSQRFTPPRGIQPLSKIARLTRYHSARTKRLRPGEYERLSYDERSTQESATRDLS